MNKQEVFNKVANHLLTQNKKSWSDEIFDCAYKNNEGLKCAIGCLISDENYYPELESCCIDSEELHKAIIKSGISLKIYKNDIYYPGGDLLFLYELQKIHDNFEPDVWRGKLSKFAEKWEFDELQISP